MQSSSAALDGVLVTTAFCAAVLKFSSAPEAGQLFESLSHYQDSTSNEVSAMYVVRFVRTISSSIDAVLNQAVEQSSGGGSAMLCCRPTAGAGTGSEGDCVLHAAAAGEHATPGGSSSTALCYPIAAPLQRTIVSGEPPPPPLSLASACCITLEGERSTRCSRRCAWPRCVQGEGATCKNRFTPY